MDLSADQDPRLNPRNRCVHEGFLSVALIPIRAGGKIVGLLQLNDRKKDRLTLDMVQDLEDISASIGLALMKKQAEEALRESEETFRSHIENSFDVIFTLDSVGTFLFVSPAWARLLGHPASDVVGSSFVQFVHPDDVAPCFASLTRVLTTGQGETSPRYRVKHADGDWRWYVTNGSSFVNKTGERRFIGVGRDITDQKHVEDALQNEKENLAAIFARFAYWNALD